MNTKNLEDVYELTPLQRGLLFHSLYAPDSGVYVEQAYLTLGGELDRDAFWQAWQTVIDRHPALRSTYHWDGIKNPVQAVHKDVTLQRHEEDWRDTPTAEHPERMRRFLLAERVRGFDLERPPLLNISLIRTADDRWYLPWRICHLIADGWSFGIILSEFITLYKDYFHGRTPQLGEPGAFRDYVAWWKRQRPQDAEPYWRESLDGYRPPAPLDLGPAEEPDEGDVPYERVELSLAGVADDLRAFSTEHRVTLHTLIQSAWMLVLSRCGAGEDVVVGAAMAHRPTDVRSGDRIVGPMVVTLPIRSELNAEQQVLPWLRDVQSSIVAAREHAGAPLTDIQGWAPGPRSADLFESIVSFENVPIPDISFPDEGLEMIDYTFDGRPQYPLSFVVLPGDDLPLRLIYDRRRFDAATARRMLRRVEAALCSVLAGPGRAVGDLDVLAADERQALAQTYRPRRETTADAALHQVVARHAAQRPDATAVTGDDESLTYRALDERANQLAHHLAALGVSPGDRVAVCGERRPGTVAAMLGVLKAGAAFVPLDPRHPRARLAHALKDSGAAVLLTEDALLTRFGDDPAPPLPVVRLDADRDEIAGRDTTPPAIEASPDDDAYVIYTSGSTGVPKGVLMTHANVVRLVDSARDIMEVGPNDVWTCFHTFAADVSVWEIWGALLTAARLAVVPSPVTRSAEAFHELLVDEQVTVALQTPRAFEQLIEAEAEVDEVTRKSLALRYLLLGAERVEPAALRPWFARRPGGGPVVLNLYGPTETTCFCTSHRITPEETERPGTPSIIGRPVADTTAYVLDRAGRPVPPGVPGELHISGPGVGRGYLGLPEATERAFVPDPFAGRSGARMYRTGDLARYGADGELEYLGRLDDQVKIRGFRVEPGEIESVLRDHPRIRNAAVVPHRQESGAVRLVACVVPDTGHAGADAADTASGVDTGEIRAWLRERLPDYMIPALLAPMPQIPLGPSGKLDTGALLAAGEAAGPDDGAVEPRTETERHLADLMAEVLERDRVGVEDNLTDLGLHSLLTTGVVSRIRKQWKVSVPLRALFETPTVAELARIIERGGSDDAPADRPGQVDLTAEVRLPESVRPAPSGGGTRPKRPEHLFLTGATGFLGAALLDRLLRDTDATVHCLVRADDEEQGRARLADALRSLDLWDPARSDRIVPVLGNLSRPALGLDDETFAALADRVDQIHHCGALVNFLHPYRRLRAANVVGTQEVLRLAATGRTTPVHYVSSGAVMGQVEGAPGEAAPALETPLDPEPPLLSNGYAQSKWVAERIVSLAGERGLPVTVHRSGRITGDSRTGMWKTGDATSEMMRACVALGMVPDFDGAVDMTPIDYVTSAISAAAASGRAAGRILHLTNPVPVSIEVLAAGLEQEGHPVTRAPVAEWYAALVRLAREDQDQDWSVALAVLGTWVHNHQRGRREPQYDCSEALSLVGATAACPQVDEDVVATYLRHFAATGYIPTPAAV